MKCLEAQFLEWKPLPMNPFNNRPYGFNNNINNAAVADEDDYNYEFLSKSFLLKKILAHNFFPQLFIYWLVDQKNIFYTSFELLVFLVTYTFFSLILASKEVTADYIKRVCSASLLTHIGDRDSDIVFFFDGAEEERDVPAEGEEDIQLLQDPVRHSGLLLGPPILGLLLLQLLPHRPPLVPCNPTYHYSARELEI